MGIDRRLDDKPPLSFIYDSKIAVQEVSNRTRFLDVEFATRLTSRGYRRNLTPAKVDRLRQFDKSIWEDHIVDLQNFKS